MARSVRERIEDFNRGREPERLALKYQALERSPFTFLRGTCHLFYADLPAHALFDRTPVAWICGDLHLENFGTYKGDNRAVYFDLNDFDEAALAPCTWEVVRLLASIYVAAEELERGGQAEELVQACLAGYAQALAAGKPRWIDREGSEANGLIGELFASLKARKRRDYVESRTELQGKRRVLRIDGKRALAATPADRERVTDFLQDFAKTQENPEFFRPLDVARRIAGTGSLGVERFVILVHGKGGVDGHYLLDLKACLPSALAPRLPQPAWPDEARRVAVVQERMQAVAPAFLRPVLLEGKPFLLKGMQPSQDRVDLSHPDIRKADLRTLLAQFGRLAAWDQLRAAGRQGAAGPDELMAFAATPEWMPAMLAWAREAAAMVQGQWQEYCAQS